MHLKHCRKSVSRAWCRETYFSFPNLILRGRQGAEDKKTTNTAKHNPQLLPLYRFTTPLVYNSSFYSTFASRLFLSPCTAWVLLKTFQYKRKGCLCFHYYCPRSSMVPSRKELQVSAKCHLFSRDYVMYCVISVNKTFS